MNKLYQESGQLFTYKTSMYKDIQFLCHNRSGERECISSFI